MASGDPPRLQTLLAQRDGLAALTRSIGGAAAGGMLSAAVDVVAQTSGASGVVAYRVDERDLKLVAEWRLPRKAKPWLARLPLGDEPWFVAQVVAATGQARLATSSGGSREGHSAEPLLREAGWRSVFAAPIAVRRRVLGVLVVAAEDPRAHDDDARRFVEIAASLAALGLMREDDAERRRDARLREAKTTQLATIGLLASTVADELASPLGRLELQIDEQRGLLQELADRLESSPAELVELGELADDVAADVRRARSITARLIAYSESSKLEMVDLAAVVTEAGELMRSALEARGLEIELRGASVPLRVVGRRESLRMVVVQLLLHAAAESAAGGDHPRRVRLGVGAVATGNAVTFESSSQRAGGAAGALSFEGLSSASPAGEPTDLSLALVKQAVLAHNGHIEIGRCGLGGALVRVVFPSASSVSARRRELSVRPAAPRPPTEQVPPAVVWIDDDDLFVRSLRRYLKGYAVHGARTVEQAKQLLRGLGDPPELVFCDLGPSPEDTIALHRSLDAALAGRFVFVTGGVLSERVAQYLIGSGRPTLIKPIALEEVAELLATDLALSERPSLAPTLDGSSRPPLPEELHDEPGGGRRFPTTLRDGSGPKER